MSPAILSHHSANSNIYGADGSLPLPDDSHTIANTLLSLASKQAIMPRMNDQHIARLEARLEHLVEGTFNQLFGKKIRTQDIAVQLARAMEDGAIPGKSDDLRPTAPDHYTIYLNTAVYAQLVQNHPTLGYHLSEHLLELATESGYRMNVTPVVDIQGDNQVSVGSLVVEANHQHQKHNTTAVMQRVDIPITQAVPLNPQLLVHGKITIPLNLELINIGRNRDNHIVIDDPSVSRHHLQLRLRFGHYVLFDTQSHGGTTVNDVIVKEYILQTGDVICIGKTRLVYLEDSAIGDTQTGDQDSFERDQAE